MRHLYERLRVSRRVSRVRMGEDERSLDDVLSTKGGSMKVGERVTETIAHGVATRMSLRVKSIAMMPGEARTMASPFVVSFS